MRRNFQPKHCHKDYLCEYHCISKPIDMDADGVLIPRTESIEQVETAISSMRFYPYGKKGVGGRALLRKGRHL